MAGDLGKSPLIARWPDLDDLMLSNVFTCKAPGWYSDFKEYFTFLARNDKIVDEYDLPVRLDPNTDTDKMKLSGLTSGEMKSVYGLIFRGLSLLEECKREYPRDPVTNDEQELVRSGVNSLMISVSFLADNAFRYEGYLPNELISIEPSLCNNFKTRWKELPAVPEDIGHYEVVVKGSPDMVSV